MELAIPLAALIVAMAALGVSVVTNRGVVSQSYVQTLMARVRHLEEQLIVTEKRLVQVEAQRRQLETDLFILRGENQRLREEVEHLRLRLDGISR